MSVYDIAADQLKSVRALSVILADGELTMPGSWNIHTFADYDPPIPPSLEGLFLDPLNPLAVKDLRVLLEVYVEKFGLTIEEKPHGGRGMVGVHAEGRWQGINLHLWGPARAEEVV